MRMASICSGIGGAELAFTDIAEHVFAAEIDPFARAVLAHHFSHIRLHGDFTEIEADGPVDALVGGTPCQSFSIAGLRRGMADERGNLALEFLRLAERLRAEWVLWENVPGVLSSSGGRDFGAFLGGLAEFGYGFAYRILDAQYFGLAQRRKRVFVVGHLGDWRRAAAVLFEPASLRGDSPPRREARETVASPLAAGHPDSSGYRNDADCLNAHGGAGRMDAESETFVTHALRAEGFDASEDGTGRGTPLVTLRTHPRPGSNSVGAITVAFNQNSRDEVTLSDGDGGIINTLKVGGGKPGQSYPAIASPASVRRLTPRECERLQGFPDDWTNVPYRGKPAADGPRYRALGNAFAVPVVRWIARRMAAEHAR